jgi:hypothetical protein
MSLIHLLYSVKLLTIPLIIKPKMDRRKFITDFADTLPVRIKQTGSPDEDPVEVFLNAGNLRVIYSNGALRYIATDGNELVRMIYAAVRDRNWLTIIPLISDQKIEKNENSFRVSFNCLYRNEEINFSADYIIEGSKDNSITFSMNGKVLERFEKNRIGFCVLHPIDGCAGRNCIIEHTDGSSEQSVFPEEISPRQVFTNIRSMIWLIKNAKCRIDFEGDVFETEDQRNWTDASFKTYSTPLSVPYPAIVEKGSGIYQKVVLRAEGDFNGETGTIEKTVIKLFPEVKFRIPSIGVCQSGRSVHLSKNEIKLLRSMRFDHYRVDLLLYESSWKQKAEQACIESSDLGYPIEFALFFDDKFDRQTTDFIKWYSQKKISVSSILLFHKSYPSTPEQLALKVISLLRDLDPDVKTVTGTNANFAQLNRNRPGETGNDGICYSIQPQEHAHDDTTLVENLKAQEYSIRSVKSFAGNKEIIISPVTIQRRFNANNTFVKLPLPGHGLPPQVDSRIMSLFGACWTTGSLKYICEAGADSVTYYETVGERGIIQGDHDSQWPFHFPSWQQIVKWNKMRKLKTPDYRLPCSVGWKAGTNTPGELQRISSACKP